MKTFKLDPALKDDYRQKNIKRRLMMFVAFMVFFFFTFFASADYSDTSIIIAIVVAGLFTAYSALGLFFSLRRIKKEWESFEIKIGEDQIQRIYPGLKDVTLQRFGISGIHQDRRGNIYIRSLKDKDRVNIIITTMVEKREEILQLLEGFGDITPYKAKARDWIQFGLAMLGFILTLVYFSLESSSFTYVLGGILIIYYFYFMIRIWRNDQAPVRVKWQAALLFIPLLAILIGMAPAILELLGQ
ncbi:MAG: hypothetical protein AAFY71_08475 [Bacteroidota bacterium]